MDHAWHPYTQHGLGEELLPVVGARGAWLELADGRRLLDGISSWWCCLHGHGHPRLVAALRRQAERLDHVLFAGCTHEPAERLAAELVEMAAPLAADGGRPLSRVFYSDDGSTAVEVALKMAYGAWARRGQPSRTVFLALEGGFHGDTFGAMSASGPDPFFADFAPFLFPVVRVKPDAAELAEALRAHEGRVCGFILEPMLQGAAGMLPHSAEFLRAARRLCDEHGVFLIADEVMTGFGRTGRTFACEHEDVVPDLLCVAKGLASGMPISACIGRAEVMDRWPISRGEALHTQTFLGHPPGCAAALASLAVLEQEKLAERAAELGSWALARLRDATAGLGSVRECRGLGLMIGVECGDSDTAAKICGEALGRGFILLPSGDRGDVLSITPPLTIGISALEAGLDTLAGLLR